MLAAGKPKPAQLTLHVLESVLDRSHAWSPGVLSVPSSQQLRAACRAVIALELSCSGACPRAP